MGYPDSRKEAWNRDINPLFEVKKQVAKPFLEALKSIDPQLVKECMIPRFLGCFYEGCKDEEIRVLVDEVVEL